MESRLALRGHAVVDVGAPREWAADVEAQTARTATGNCDEHEIWTMTDHFFEQNGRWSGSSMEAKRTRGKAGL